MPNMPPKKRANPAEIMGKILIIRVDAG
jgi:hypothetical protein